MKFGCAILILLDRVLDVEKLVNCSRTFLLRLEKSDVNTTSESTDFTLQFGLAVSMSHVKYVWPNRGSDPLSIQLPIPLSNTLPWITQQSHSLIAEKKINLSSMQQLRPPMRVPKALALIGDDRKTIGVILIMTVLSVVHGVCFVQAVVVARMPFLVINWMLTNITK